MKDFFLHNYKIKIISVLLGAGLWWFVYASQNPRLSTSFPVTINYVNLAPEFKLDQFVKTVRVELHGDSRKLEEVGPENLEATADLSGLGEGRHVVGIKVNNRTGLRMNKRISSIEVFLLPLKKIDLPVELKLSGALKTGYIQGQVTYKPMAASIFGDDNDLKMVAKIVAEVDVSGREKSFRTKASLRALDGDGNAISGVHLSPKSVAVVVTVQSEQGKTAPVNVRFTNPEAKDNYPNADYYPHEVSLGGDPLTQRKISAVDTEEFDLAQCSAGGSYQVKLKLPANVTADPAQITFSCEPQKSFERELTVPIHAINLCETCKAGLQPVEIKVTVTGRPDVVNGLTQSDISASVDVLGVKTGEHEAVPFVHLNKASDQIKLEYPNKPVKVVISK
jgi:YbbR domain-containing protein